MSLRTLVNSDLSWLPELAARRPIERKRSVKPTSGSVRRATPSVVKSNHNKAKFEGIDVYVVSQLDEATLFALIDGAIDWSPFEMVDLIKIGHGGAYSNSHATEDEWLCRFKFKARYKDAKPLISSLLDSIEHVVPWTLAEKIFENKNGADRTTNNKSLAA